MANGVEISLDSAINPGGWPLLTDTSLVKPSVNGVASWTAADHLRITKSVAGYILVASGLGQPVNTNPFDIIPGVATQLRFAQQPVNVKTNVPMATPVLVEVTDNFGNRTETNTDVTLSLPSSNLGSIVANNTAATIDGLATFNSIVFDTPFKNGTLLANAANTTLVGGVSSTFSVDAENAFPIALNSALLKKKQFKFAARGSFTISKEALNDPTKRGASLKVIGTTGSVTYRLPKSGWTTIDGNKGFQFSDDQCQSVIVMKKSIQANCNGKKTGTIKFPETEIDVQLSLGKGTAKFCGRCGGTSVGDETKKLKRVNCAAPETCP